MALKLELEETLILVYTLQAIQMEMELLSLVVAVLLVLE